MRLVPDNLYGEEVAVADTVDNIGNLSWQEIFTDPRLQEFRTFPVERLRSQGCWPVTGGRVQMTYAFTGQPAAAPP